MKGIYLVSKLEGTFKADVIRCSSEAMLTNLLMQTENNRLFVSQLATFHPPYSPELYNRAGTVNNCIPLQALRC